MAEISTPQIQNTTAQAFQARTQQLESDQRQKDNDMLKVFDMAGDGHTDEAAYYAQAKGLQVPPEVIKNSDFAKGLSLSGKFYGNDKAAAQKFTTAWMQTQGQDFDTRMATAQKAAGVPVNEADREYQRKLDFERWKIKNGAYNKKIPGKLEFAQDAFNKVLQYGGGDVDAAKAAYDDASKRWDAAYGQAAGGAGAPAAPSAAMGDTSLPPVFQDASPGLTLPVNTQKPVNMALPAGTPPMAAPQTAPAPVQKTAPVVAPRLPTKPVQQPDATVSKYRTNVERDSYAQQVYITALKATGDVDTALQAKQVAYRDYDHQNIPPKDVDFLKKNPQTRDRFDAYWGAGASGAFLAPEKPRWNPWNPFSPID